MPCQELKIQNSVRNSVERVYLVHKEDPSPAIEGNRQQLKGNRQRLDGHQRRLQAISLL